MNPQSIVVVGASNDLRKAGGKMLHNLMTGSFQGQLMVVNKRESQVQGLAAFSDLTDLPEVDLAILAIPANACPKAIELLASEKKCKAFIVISAGFGELNEAGAALEAKMIATDDRYQTALVGPNCIGIINEHYQGVFTTPIPTLDKQQGCTLISSSGATAVFLMEAGMQVGLRFSGVYSVGNGKQINTEDFLAYLDQHFDPLSSSKNILLYMENISKPQKLLKHAISLINKGC